MGIILKYTCMTKFTNFLDFTIKYLPCNKHNALRETPELEGRGFNPHKNVFLPALSLCEIFGKTSWLSQRTPSWNFL